MKLYINTKKMMFKEDNIEHEIVVGVTDEEFIGYDLNVDKNEDDDFVKNTLRIKYKKDKKGKDTEEIESKHFQTSEQDTWNSFPLYEIINGGIVSFDYTRYQYFKDTDRRIILGKKVMNLYNIPSELKILRETLRYVMDELNLDYPNNFSIMNKKINEVIEKNPKEGTK